MNVAAHVLAARMAHGLMRHASAHKFVSWIFVSRDQRNFLISCAAHERAESRGVHRANDASHDVALALDSSDHADLAIADCLAKPLRALGFAYLGAFLVLVAIAILPPM